jgi:long-chain fatty acid transport protein
VTWSTHALTGRLFGAVLGLSALAAWADGVHMNGLSPRAVGRGGTNIAHADNGAVFFDNPAAAVNVAGNGLMDVGGNLLIMDFRYSDPDNPTSYDLDITPLPSMGLVQKTEDGRFAYGLGVYAPAGFQQMHNLQSQFPFPGTHTYKSFAALTKILPGAAVKVNDRLAVGGTFGVAVSHAELEGPYTLQNAGLFSGLPTLVDLQATGATPVFSFGLQYELTEATTFGMTYQSVSRFELEGSTLVTIPVLGSARYDTHVDMTWPETLGFGLRHELCPHRILSAELVWFNWSGAFDSIGVQMSDADRLLFPDINEQLPLNWQDTLSLKFGYEQVLPNGHVARCGYIYHRNPVPDGTLTPYIQAILEHAFSVGYGVQWRGWEIDASYMFLFSPEVTVGTSDLLGGDFSNSINQAFIHALGLSVIKRF